MKQSEIKAGRTYVSKNGKTQRTVLRLSGSNRLIFSESGRDGYEMSIFVQNFASWAKSEVKELPTFNDRAETGKINL